MAENSVGFDILIVAQEQQLLKTIDSIEAKFTEAGKKSGTGFLKEMVDKLKGIKEQVSKSFDVTTEAKKAGDRAGKGFASAFGREARRFGDIFRNLGYASAAGGIFGFSGEILSKSIESRQSDARIDSALLGYQRNTSKNVGILSNDSSSLEAKGGALGMKVSDMYEEVSVTSQATEASKRYRKEINDKENAYREEERAIKANISAIEKKRDLEITQIREKEGYSGFTSKRREVERQILELQIQNSEQLLNQEDTAALATQNLILLKKEEMKIIEDNISLIALQTDQVKDLRDVEIASLKDDLDSKKMQLDIDIAPAKEAVDELSSYAGGKIRQLKDGVLDKIKAGTADAKKNGANDIMKANNLKASDIRSAAKSFSESKGVVTQSATQAVFGNLLQAGLVSVQAMKDVSEQLLNIAAVNRDPQLSLEEGFIKLGENYRNEIPSQGDIAGLLDEYKQTILPRGLSAIQSNTDKYEDIAVQLFGQEKAMQVLNNANTQNAETMDENTRKLAKYAGLIETGNIQAADGLKKAQENGALTMERFTILLSNIQKKIGDAFLNFLNSDAGQKALEGFKIALEITGNHLSDAFAFLGTKEGQKALETAFDYLKKAIHGAAEFLNWAFAENDGKFFGVDLYDFLPSNIQKLGKNPEELREEIREKAKKSGLFSQGGLIPGGYGGGDTHSAMLEPGEFVLRKEAVKRLGLSNVEMLNGGGSTNNDNRQYSNESNNFSLSGGTFSSNFRQQFST